MFYIFNLPSTYPYPFDGVWDIPSKSMGVGVNTINVSIDRCTSNTPNIWANTNTQVEVALEVSHDNEATWVGGGILRSLGGISSYNGVEGKQSIAMFKYQTDITHARATITVTNGPLVSNLRIWVG